MVVVTCHWGVEDTYNVTDGVKALAQKIIDWGGDVIIGTHPHVAQTMEYLTRPDGTQGLCVLFAGEFHFCPDGQHEPDRGTGRLQH